MQKTFLVLLLSSVMAGAPWAFADDSLYDRMGGAPVAAKVVDQLYSIRINDQWRLCFIWRDGAAHRVEITDYH